MSEEIIESDRLIIRAFISDDLPVIHRILNQAFDDDGHVITLEERRSWLQWSILSQAWFTKKHQPPYGDRAVTLKATGTVIGSVGYVPCLDVYEQIPELCDSSSPGSYTTTEVGLFWVIDPAHQRQGYATEVAQAMINNAFKQMQLKRIIATTEFENTASQGVMKKVGMAITRNPLPDPPWLQIVGVLENSG